ncbi:MAG: hypothetical protein KAH95_01085 [Spirochaetales bacterium]|nr:hypothetical protein [Spirochaetales bacterium]
MFTVTHSAIEMMKEMIENSENENFKITVCSSGVGCGGPSLKVEMRAAMENDLIETVEGITFHIRENIYKNLQGSEIDEEDTFWGKRLHVKTSYGCI